MASGTAPPVSPTSGPDLRWLENSIYSDKFTEWDPTFLTTNGSREKWKQSRPIYAVIVLNQPIQSKRQLLNLCRRAHWKVFADGAANRVYDTDRTLDDNNILVPDMICGDLDSIHVHSLQWFSREGAALVCDPNQNKTDLQKCLKSLRDLAKEWQDGEPVGYNLPPGFMEKDLTAVLMGGIGGRFDHGFSQIHHLYQESQDEYQFKGCIYLVNTESICFLLNRGLNRIYTPLGTGLFRESVGIIPIGRPSYIRTTGLEWNLTGELNEFGGLVSTSNHIIRNWIEIDTSERVLFTVELDPPRADSPISRSHFGNMQSEVRARMALKAIPGASSTEGDVVKGTSKYQTGP